MSGLVAALLPSVLAAVASVGTWLALRPGPASRWPGVAGVEAPDDGVAGPTGPHPGRGVGRGDSGDVAVAADLLAVALSTGVAIHAGVLAVGDLPGGPAALALAAGRVRRGAPLLEVLDEMPTRHGGRWQPLCTTLSVGATSGMSVISALQRVGSSERLRARRVVERRIRRLPVLLLLPTAGLVLPAFALVTVVPLLVGSAAVLSSP